MKNFFLLGLLLTSSTQIGLAQVAGGAGTYDQNVDSLQIEVAKRQPTAAELKDDGSSTFVEASILMNVKADEYIAIFGVSQEAKTPQAANVSFDAVMQNFTTSLRKLGVASSDISVDFIAQNRIYAFRIEEKPETATSSVTTAKEELAGFELKKNVSIRFKDKNFIDKLVSTAALFEIYDLIKVDYVVKDVAAIQAKLRLQTMAILKDKTRLYGETLGVKFSAPTQILADKSSIYYPVQQYDSYVAAESEKISLPYERSRYTIQNARKSRTSYFNPLRGDDFDLVVNPVILEPVVQFTTYLKAKYAAPKTP